MDGYLFPILKNPTFHESVAKGMIQAAVLTFVILYFMIDAPYGKFSDSSKKTLISGIMGPSIPARLAWFIFESPNLIWSVICWCTRNDQTFQAPNAILLFIFVAHYINRAVVYPFCILNRESKPMPLFVVASATTFCLFNGYLQAQGLCQFQSYPEGYVQSFRFLGGICICFFGMAINQQADSILRNLRKPGEKGYVIPHDGAFTYVSSAHYFGEIVEWLGYAIAVNRISGFAFFIYTVSNLAPRAVSSHRWYQEKFGEKYPKNRKAVVPFLW